MLLSAWCSELVGSTFLSPKKALWGYLWCWQVSESEIKLWGELEHFYKLILIPVWVHVIPRYSCNKFSVWVCKQLNIFVKFEIANINTPNLLPTVNHSYMHGLNFSLQHKTCLKLNISDGRQHISMIRLQFQSAFACNYPLLSIVKSFMHMRTCQNMIRNLVYPNEIISTTRISRFSDLLPRF